MPVDAACLAKAAGKFTASLNKVSGCTGDGDAAGILSLVKSECVDDMIQVDNDGNVLGIRCGSPPSTTTSTTTTTTIPAHAAAFPIPVRAA